MTIDKNTKQSTSWSIIILAYNEASTIEKVIIDTFKVLEQLATQYEILVVNDGSQDKTKELVLDQQKKRPQIRLIDHKENLGIGAALSSGYLKARFDNVCAIPGDGQFDVGRLLEIPWPQKDNEVICFYRLSKPGYSFYRHGLSYFNRLLNRALYGFELKDVNWIKVYKKAQLESVVFFSASSFVESEVCLQLHRQGCKFREHPSEYLPRLGGQSHGGDITHALKATMDAGTYFYRQLLKRDK